MQASRAYKEFERQLEHLEKVFSPAQAAPAS